MKYLIVIIVILFSLNSKGQTKSTTVLLIDKPTFYPKETFEIVKGFECNGRWVPGVDYYTDWVTVDTIGSKKELNENREWICDEFKKTNNNSYQLGIYRPCGDGSPTIYTQFRICTITGIRQKREHIYPKVWQENEKTEYEKVLEKKMSEK